MIRRALMVAVVCALAFCQQTGMQHNALAGALPRIASINACTDQLLLAVADPDQIVGLSPFARDASQSGLAKEAARYPLLSGGAEDLLMLRPDVVVAGTFTNRATRDLLRQHGFDVAEFDVAQSIGDVRKQFRRMGEVAAHPGRAEAEISRLDAALARTKAAAVPAHFRVLALSRRGWVAGAHGLVASILEAAGLINAADDLGLTYGGFASLETIVRLRPDLILVDSGSEVAQDQGEAFLLHPALERLYPPAKRMVLPDALTVCGGPMLATALDRLTAELQRIGTQ